MPVNPRVVLVEARELEGAMVTTILPGFEVSTLVVPMVLGPGGASGGMLSCSLSSGCFLGKPRARVALR